MIFNYKDGIKDGEGSIKMREDAVFCSPKGRDEGAGRVAMRAASRMAGIITHQEREGLIRSVSRVTRDDDAAEDCLQAAFVRLEEYRRHKVVDSDVRFLARAARNIAIDEARKSRVRASSAGDIRVLLENYQNAQPLQDEVLLARERLSRARAVLASLPERTRAVFMMHRFTRAKYREIAVELGISVSAVEKHIARASLALADSVEREGDIPEC